MDKRSKDLKISLSEWSFKQLPISLSAQRPLASIKNMKAYPKYNPSFNPNNNSLKYLKLAPISSLSNSASTPIIKSPITTVCPPESPSLPMEPSINRRVSRCGFHSQKGQTNGFPKDQNQDNILIIPKVNNIPFQFLFGVFDGHGSFGHSVSSIIKNRIKSTISSLKPSTSLNDLKDFLYYSINLANQTVLASPINTKDSGSTLCMLAISGNNLACANIGDSRCILISRKVGEVGMEDGVKDCQENCKWEIFQMSKDHKPSDKEEAERVVKCGGIVDKDPFNNNETEGILRVWSKNSKVPGLAMTRSIGDTWLKKLGVTSDPEILTKELNAQDKFIILASDGLWDMISEQDCAEIVNHTISEGNHAKLASQALVEEATKRWKSKGNNIDDISVIVILLNNKHN